MANEKKPIDRRRDSGGSMTVGVSEEGNLTSMIPLGDTLYMIKERAIYAVKLADQIDPERTNIAIPNVQQKWASAGSESPLVCRTLLTAKELFNDSYLDRRISCERAISLVMQILQDLLAISEEEAALKRAEEDAIRTMESQADNLRIAAVTNVSVRAKDVIQKAEHIGQSMYALCKLFYEHELEAKGKFFEGFAEVVRQKYGERDNFMIISTRLAKFGKFLRNSRHCIEHPKEGQRVVTSDFTLLANGKIEPPTIEIIHEETPEPRIPMRIFISNMIASLLNASEDLMAFLCSKNLQRLQGISVVVSEVPAEQRANKQIRYGYVAFFGDQIVRAS